MKVVKLDRRHRLFHRGMTHAFKFENEWDARKKVEDVLRKKYGWEYSNDNWSVFRGKSVRDKTQYYNRTYPYWIGVKHPSDVSIVMLQV